MSHAESAKRIKLRRSLVASKQLAQFEANPSVVPIASRAQGRQPSCVAAKTISTVPPHECPPQTAKTLVDCRQAGAIRFSEVQFRSAGGGAAHVCTGVSSAKILAIRAFRESDLVGTLGDKRIAPESGEVHVHPVCEPISAVANHLEVMTAYVPYELVGIAPSTSPKHIKLYGNSFTATLMISTIRAALDAEEEIPACDVLAFRSTFAELLRGLVDHTDRSNVFSDPVEQAMGMAFRVFIRQSISDEDLSVHQICRAFGASRRAVHRAFELDGGVANYILRQRLQRAVLDLTTFKGGLDNYTAIVKRWGFADARSFNGALRQQFGLQLSDFAPRFGHKPHPERHADCSAARRCGAPLESWMHLERSMAKLESQGH